jgi:hypothetical protein
MKRSAATLKRCNTAAAQPFALGRIRAEPVPRGGAANVRPSAFLLSLSSAM